MRRLGRQPAGVNFTTDVNEVSQSAEFVVYLKEDGELDVLSLEKWSGFWGVRG